MAFTKDITNLPFTTHTLPFFFKQHKTTHSHNMNTFTISTQTNSCFLIDNTKNQKLTNKKVQILQLEPKENSNFFKQREPKKI